MKFVNPGWLWALTGLPLLYAFLVWELKVRQERMARFASREVWTRISPDMDWTARLRKGRIWLAAVAFALIALARPQWGKHEEIVQVTGLDIIIALDVSNSMEVEDVPPSRMKKAKHLIRSFLERLGGDRVGVVAFAGSAYLATPLTTDLSYVAETVEILGPKMVTNQGTDIGIALETAARALERGAEEGAKKTDDSLRSRVVILISDGEDHRGGAASEAKKLGDSGARVYVLGVGTEKGGPIPTRDDSGQLFGYKRTRKGEPIISAFKADSLQSIAREAGGKYWTVSNSETELDEILADVGALDRGEISEKRKVTYEDRFQIPLFIALLLLLLEMTTPARKMRKEMAAAVLILAWSLSAQASPKTEIDVWSKTKRGVEAFREGKAEEAQKRFEEAQSLDPTRPEVLFNQGVIQSQKGDADSAIQIYGQAAELAGEQGNGRVAAGAKYNLGNALARKGDFANALKQYLSALDESRKLEDDELEADIRRNIELLQKKKKDQQQKKQDQQLNQDQKNQDQPDQKDQKDQKQQAKNQEKKNSESKSKPDQAKQDQENRPGQYEKPGKRQFQSQKLSPEDAERVMADLAAKERELQGRLKKQRGQSQTTDRDW